METHTKTQFRRAPFRQIKNRPRQVAWNTSTALPLWIPYEPYPVLRQVGTGILSRKTPVRPWPRMHYRISHSPRSYSPAFLKPTRSGYHTTHCQCTSREVNEARGPHTCSRPCAFKGKQNRKTHTYTRKKKKNPPHPKHTTKSTAAPRPRPPRDGARRNTSHTRYIAHARPLPQIPGCGNRPRTALAIGKNHEECYAYTPRQSD